MPELEDPPLLPPYFAHRAVGRIALLMVAVWVSVWFGMYRLDSAPLAFLFYHVVCLLGGWLLRAPGLPPRERISKLTRRFLLATVVLANGFILVLYLMIGKLLLDRPHILGLLTHQGLPPTLYPLLFPYFALVNPFAEEFFWRGGVYATLRRLLPGEWSAVMVASLLFGAWHWLVVRLFVGWWLALVAVGMIALVGVVLTVVYERTRRLAYPILLHALAGDTPLLLLLLLVERG